MANVYLACFIIGFALTVISFLMGFAGHSFGHHGDIGHGGDAGGHGGHGVDVGDGGDEGLRNLLHRSSGPSLINFGMVTAFLTWFGGIGFLMTTYSHLVTLITVGISV